MTDRQRDVEETPSVFDSINVAQVQPGDVLIFRSPERLQAESRAHIAAMMEEVFPDNESIVLEGGQDIAVLRPAPGLIAPALRRLLGRS